MSHTPKNITDPDSHVDEWFKHDPSEPHHQESHGKFNNTGIFAVLGVTIVGTFLIAIVVIYWTNQQVYDIKSSQQEATTRYTAEKNETFGNWKESLHGEPEWIDTASGTVSIPLDTATQNVLRRYQQSGS